ncbi:MAG TPA: T9SS type A sorting domain-containing protein, partial [Bacteroidia bacterium]|nr:T9SS type A sorting domain-containing protein [Bacteroidia bacterium]
AGHKFPSGYPSRRIFVEFVLRDANGDTIFQSGVLGPDYEVLGQDAGYEPHHNIIKDQGQAQIYEFIMADVNGDVTTTLERAATHLKDNRLVPQGFSSNHSNYNDTTEIAGTAENDPDFNHDGATEGTGSDIVHYHVPLNGYTGALQVSARLWYQTVRPGWLDETFSHSSPDIDRFERWYNGSDRSVVLVGELLTQDVIIGTQAFAQPSVIVFPNPTQDGWVNLLLPKASENVTVRVYDLNGRLVMPAVTKGSAVQKLQIPSTAGTYLLDLQGTGWRKTIKVLRK